MPSDANLDSSAVRPCLCEPGVSRTNSQASVAPSHPPLSGTIAALEAGIILSTLN
jgi:hypothetical protein